MLANVPRTSPCGIQHTWSAPKWRMQIVCATDNAVCAASVLAEAKKKRGGYDCRLAQRDGAHKKREDVPHGGGMPVVELEVDGQHQRYEVPQYLKAVHCVDFQGNAAKKTEQVCKQRQLSGASTGIAKRIRRRTYGDANDGGRESADKAGLGCIVLAGSII